MKVYKSMKVAVVAVAVIAMTFMGTNASGASCDSHPLITNDGVCREFVITLPMGGERRELNCGNKILPTDVLSCIIGGLAGPG